MKFNYKSLTSILLLAAALTTVNSYAQNNNSGFSSGSSFGNDNNNADASNGANQNFSEGRNQAGGNNSVSIERLKQEAADGDKTKQTQLGYYYYTGTNIGQDYNQAFYWFDQAYKNGSIRSIEYLADCYYYGHGVEKDVEKAQMLYKEAAKKIVQLQDVHDSGKNPVIDNLIKKVEENESPELYAVLYDIYLNAMGTERNTRLADEYLKKAAELGDVTSMYNYAKACYTNKKYDEAAEWYEKASEKGHAASTFYYATMLFKGSGVGQDKQKAIELFKKASEQNFHMADYELGRIYLDGDGADKNEEMAVKYLKEAAPHYKLAAYRLAMCYKDGVGVDRSFYYATHWMAQSIDSSDECSKRIEKLLADDNNGAYTQYLRGLYKFCLDENYEDAINYFKKVEKAKVMDGTMMMALCYQNLNDAKKAFKTMEKAAKTEPIAMYYLSEFYKNGVGTPKDNNLSLQFLKEAAGKGVGLADANLGDVYMEGIFLPRDPTQAAIHYMQAEKMKQLTPTAAGNFAKCYVERINIIPDLNNAENRIKELQEWKEDKTKMNILLGRVPNNQ